MTQEAFDYYQAAARSRRDKIVAKLGKLIFYFASPGYHAFLSEVVARGVRSLDEQQSDEHSMTS
jgi:hypothetical protein